MYHVSRIKPDKELILIASCVRVVQQKGQQIRRSQRSSTARYTETSSVLPQPCTTYPSFSPSRPRFQRFWHFWRHPQSSRGHRGNRLVHLLCTNGQRLCYRSDALRKPPIKQINSATPHWDDLFEKMFTGNDLCEFDAVVLVDQPGVRMRHNSTILPPTHLPI